jgi:hypothetical protein
MQMNNAQLAALVERARRKPLPVVSPPPPQPAVQRPVRARQAKPASSAAQPPSELPRPVQVAVPSPPSPPEHTVEIEDFPIGWQLDKSSWQFHRRFYAIFRRPMRPGEYTHLFKQIRRREAEHLGEDCWRVRLSDGRTTLPVRAARWRLITILPKNWQPPTSVAASSSGPGASEHVQEPDL